MDYVVRYFGEGADASGLTIGRPYQAPLQRQGVADRQVDNIGARVVAAGMGSDEKGSLPGSGERESLGNGRRPLAGIVREADQGDAPP